MSSLEIRKSEAELALASGDYDRAFDAFSQIQS